MTALFVQETSPTFVFPFDFGRTRERKPLLTLETGTSAGASQVPPLAVDFNTSPFLKAKMSLRSTRNNSVAKNASAIIFVLEKLVAAFPVTNHLPLINYLELEDGSLLLEWIFDDARLGFNVEPNWAETGWFAASAKEAGGTIASGLLASTNPQTFILIVLATISSYLNAGRR